MMLDGALKPLHRAPSTGSSTVIKSNCKKQCKSYRNTNVYTLTVNKTYCYNNKQHKQEQKRKYSLNRDSIKSSSPEKSRNGMSCEKISRSKSTFKQLTTKSVVDQINVYNIPYINGKKLVKDNSEYCRLIAVTGEAHNVNDSDKTPKTSANANVHFHKIVESNEVIERNCDTNCNSRLKTNTTATAIVKATAITTVTVNVNTSTNTNIINMEAIEIENGNTNTNTNGNTKGRLAEMSYAAIKAAIAATSAAISISVLIATKLIEQVGYSSRMSSKTFTSSSLFHVFLATPFRFSEFLMLYLCCIFICGPMYVRGDDSDNFFAVNSFSMGPETTTPEFDYVSRGKKKFGDKCEKTLECGFPGSICDPKKKSCQCTEDLPVTNHIDKCGKEAAVNESCFFNEQCEMKYFQTECRDGRCVCRFEMTPIWAKDGTVECKGRQEKRSTETYIDPAMIGVLVGMALMFVIICVVLRLFSQARWRENRTIFNTPNPRLMNVSLLRDSKLLHGQERRGSRMSVRAPSRQPSMASLRPHSPNPSLGSRSGSNGSGNSASATSLRSTRSNSVAPGNVSSVHHERKGSAYRDGHMHQHQHQTTLMTNITANPVAESVTVEIIEPEK